MKSENKFIGVAFIESTIGGSNVEFYTCAPNKFVPGCFRELHC